MIAQTSQKNIPKEWQRVKLGDISRITNGKTNSQDAVADGEYPLFDRSVVIKRSNKYIFDDTAVILPGEGAEFVPRYYKGRFDLHQRVYAIFPNSSVNPVFLFQYLNANRAIFAQNAVGSTVKSLRLPIIQSVDVLLPPATEQEKIAEILSTVDDEIQKTDEIIAASEKLKRGLMRDLLSFRDRSDVKFMTFGEIGKVSMCKRVFKEETSASGDIPFYKIGTFGKEADAYISKELFEKYREKYPFPKKGDVLISASGTIGRKVVYDGNPGYFQDSNIIWLEHDESKILNNFLFYLYDTIEWQTEGSTIKRLYNDLFLKRVVPVPVFEEQRGIVSVLSAVDGKISVNQTLKERLILLKKSLTQDLLSGRKQTV